MAGAGKPGQGSRPTGDPQQWDDGATNPAEVLAASPRLPITAPLDELADDPATIRMPQREAKREARRLDPRDLSGAVTSEIAEPEPPWPGRPGDDRALPVAPPGERRLAKTIIGVGSPELHDELRAIYAEALRGNAAVEPIARPPSPADDRTPPPVPEPRRPALDPDITLPHAHAPEPRPGPAELATGPVKPPARPQDLNLSEHVKAVQSPPAGPPPGMIPFGLDVDDQDQTVPAGSLAKAMQHQEADALSSTDKLAALDKTTDRVVALEEPPPLPDDATSPAPPPSARPSDSTAPALPPVDEPVTFDPAPLLKPRPLPPGRGTTQPPPQPVPARRTGGPSTLLLVMLWVVAALSVGVAVFLYIR